LAEHKNFHLIDAIKRFSMEQSTNESCFSQSTAWWILSMQLIENRDAIDKTPFSTTSQQRDDVMPARKLRWRIDH